MIQLLSLELQLGGTLLSLFRETSLLFCGEAVVFLQLLEWIKVQGLVFFRLHCDKINGGSWKLLLEGYQLKGTPGKNLAQPSSGLNLKCHL